MTVGPQIEHLQPPEMAAPLGMYAQVTRDSRTGLVFVAGQVALDPAGKLVGQGDFRAQARETFRNVGKALDAAGAGFDTVVKLTTYIVRERDLPQFRAVRGEIYNEIYPHGGYPPHLLLIVAGLSAPEHLIEVEAIAFARNGRADG